MKTLIASLIFATVIMTAAADIPEGYYDTLDGKSGQALTAAIRELAEGHRTVTYNTKTWPAFEKTDVREIGGRRVWWDMYSNNIVYLPDHASLNIEHSVANSWWGGKNGSAEAYADLFHLNPSDQNANNKKGNYPPGEVVEPRLLDNGLLRIGTPANGQGGGAANVFEPADEYKGDFARAYFYVFAVYGNLTWKEESAYVYDEAGALRPWAAEMLLRWHRQDPVDSKEMARNEAVYVEQGNRNPFIDYPALAEHVWGDNSEVFSLTGNTPAVAIDRPEAPVFKGTRLTGVNTYSSRWWDGRRIELAHSSGELLVSIDGGSFRKAEEIVLDPAENGSESHSFSAYTRIPTDDGFLNSPMARLSMLAADPMVTDYSAARWELVDSETGFNPSDGPFMIIAAPTLRVMTANGGTSSTAFMECGGYVDFSGELVTEMPVDAAIVRFERIDASKYRLMLSDIYDRYQGSWNATAKNKMKLDAVTYTPGTARIEADNTFSFTFDQYGSLQYNASQPRFLNYESNQKPVYLYRFKDYNGGVSGISGTIEDTQWGIGIEDNSIRTDGESRIYDLSGRQVGGRDLRPGTYIVVSPSGSRKIIL